MTRFRFLLPLLLAVSGRAGIAITDTAVGRTPWLVLSPAGKEKPRLRIKDETATLDLVDGTRLELHAGRASVLIAGKLHVLSPSVRIADGRLLLPRKATQELFEAKMPSQFLCEEDGDCAFTAIEPAASSKRTSEKVAAPKPPSAIASPRIPVTAPVQGPKAPASAARTQSTGSTNKSAAGPAVPKAVNTTPVPSPKPQPAQKDPDPPVEPEIEESPRAAKARKDITIVVDAGHGGKDPGASGKTEDGNAVKEKDVTLGVAKKLRDALKRAGFKVVMTRDDDHFEELKARASIANKAKGNLFISLHCNAVPARKEQAKGFRVYLLREAQSEKDKAIERRENAAIALESPRNRAKKGLSPIEWMQIEHQLNLYTKESERFSGLVVSNLQRNGPVKKEHTGAGQAGFFVLVGALMPSVLVEMGYVSHPSEMLTLSDSGQQERIAGQISRSVESFFSHPGGK